MKKIILEFLLISFTIIILFIHNIEIKNNMYYILIYSIKNIIPSMFPIIFITNYIKYKILPKCNNKYIKYISLMFSYAPSNAVISNSNKEMLYASIINPLYSYYILNNIFNIKESILIIFINMFINYLLLFKKITINNNLNIKNSNINTILKDTTNSIINILGIIIFYNLVISILSIYINSKLLFFLEITNGFNIISSIKNINIRIILYIFLNSFCGIAIYTQIKSINNDANYKLLIDKFLISIFITFVTYILIMIL